jgi:soluble lytic murein transglycosylase-like protein/tetratricopeptide (TPR) repeat protein
VWLSVIMRPIPPALARFVALVLPALLLAGAAPVALPPGIPLPSALPGRSLGAAVEAFERGDLVLARRELDALLAAGRPAAEERPRAWFLLAWVDRRLGLLQQASAAFHKVAAEKDHPLRELAMLLLARSDLERGHGSAALTQCEAYGTEFPDGEHRDECSLIEAEALLQSGNRKAATERWDAFLLAHPDDARREGIALAVAQALEEDGDGKRAAQQYRALYLAHRLPTTGDAAEAGLRRLEAFGVDLPTLTDAQLYDRACSLRATGDSDESWRLFCELESRNPAAGEGATELGRRLHEQRDEFLWRTRQYDEVGEAKVRAYEKAPEAPGAAELLYDAVQAFTRSGDFERALRYQTLGIERFPEHGRFARTWERSALLYVGAGRYAEAREAYRAWREDSSSARRDAETGFLVAYLAWKARALNEAAEELGRIANDRGKFRSAARWFLAKTKEAQGDKKAAKKELERLAEEDPDSWYALLARSREMEKGSASLQARARQGRWPGPSRSASLVQPAPPATPPADAVLRMAASLAAAPRSADAASPVNPAPSRLSRDPDGRLRGQPAADGWADPKLLARRSSESGSAGSGAEAPRSPAPGLPGPSHDTAVPAPWSAGPRFDPVRARALWEEVVETLLPFWPRLGIALELSAVGLGELSGPIAAEVWHEVRDIRRDAGIRRAVKRWKSSGGKDAPKDVEKWAAAVDLQLATSDWMHVFAAAGYAANVSAFAAESISYTQLPRSDEASRAVWTLRFPAAFAPQVWNAAWDQDIDPLLLLSLMRQESHYRHDAVSRVGALGLIQIMPATGARVAALMGESGFHVESLLDPEANIRLGAFYLGRLMERFPGQYPLAIGAYNGGPHNIARWLRPKLGMPLDEFVEEIAFPETRDYVKKVIQHYAVYVDVYAPGDWVRIPTSTRADEPTGIDF